MPLTRAEAAELHALIQAAGTAAHERGMNVGDADYRHADTEAATALIGWIVDHTED